MLSNVIIDYVTSKIGMLLATKASFQLNTLEDKIYLQKNLSHYLWVNPLSNKVQGVERSSNFLVFLRRKWPFCKIHLLSKASIISGFLLITLDHIRNPSGNLNTIINISLGIKQTFTEIENCIAIQQWFLFNFITVPIFIQHCSFFSVLC